jgi:hypothetical protein
MSINRLTNDALREDFRREPAVDGRGGYSAPSYMTPAVQRELAVDQNQVTESLETLVKYIPTEAVTLYVATLSAEQAAALASAGLRSAHHLLGLLPGHPHCSSCWSMPASGPVTGCARCRTRRSGPGGS